MLDALAPHSNILRVGYPAQWVFRGCDFGGLGKFGPRVVAAAGRRNCDLGRHAGVGVQAGSGSALPASNVQNQSLSSIAVAPVAPMPSHRLTGSAVFCALDTARRLIASFQTASAMARIAAHRSAPPSSPVGGGGPLSVRARVPMGVAQDRPGFSKKPAFRPPRSLDADAPAFRGRGNFDRQTWGPGWRCLTHTRNSAVGRVKVPIMESEGSGGAKALSARTILAGLRR